jgi:acetyl esterase/lipase
VERVRQTDGAGLTVGGDPEVALRVKGRDEDVLLAERLIGAGVVTEFHLWPGAYHGSEWMAPEAELSQRIIGTRLAALRRALSV